MYSRSNSKKLPGLEKKINLPQENLSDTQWVKPMRGTVGKGPIIKKIEIFHRKAACYR